MTEKVLFPYILLRRVKDGRGNDSDGQQNTEHIYECSAFFIALRCIMLNSRCV